MIHVQVTERDIRRGRLKAGDTCGCPVWLGLRRSLRSIVNSGEELLIPTVEHATLGKFKLLLPDEAIEFQEELMRDFSAPVEPFEFDADVELRRAGR